jgi:hypothetical protein
LDQGSSRLARFSFSAAFAAAVACAAPQSAHGGTTADIPPCLGVPAGACAYEIVGESHSCPSLGPPAALGPDCELAEFQPRNAGQQSFQFLCTTPLCVASPEQSAKGTRDLLLGAALPLLLGMLALVGAMGIRPRA